MSVVKKCWALRVAWTRPCCQGCQVARITHPGSAISPGSVQVSYSRSWRRWRTSRRVWRRSSCSRKRPSPSRRSKEGRNKEEEGFVFFYTITYICAHRQEKRKDHPLCTRSTLPPTMTATATTTTHLLAVRSILDRRLWYSCSRSRGPSF